MKKLALACFICLLCASCGQTGPLMLPSDDTPDNKSKTTQH